MSTEQLIRKHIIDEYEKERKAIADAYAYKQLKASVIAEHLADQKDPIKRAARKAQREQMLQLVNESKVSKPMTPWVKWLIICTMIPFVLLGVFLILFII